MVKSNKLKDLTDRELLAESRKFEAKVTADAASLNLSAADADAIRQVNDEFEFALDQWDAIQAQKKSIYQGKKSARRVMLNRLRSQRKRLYADPSLSESELVAAGLPPRDKTKTASPAPETAPLAWLEYAKLKHLIHFRDTATPDKRAKPKGILGCEIWYYLGTSAPEKDSDYKYIAIATRSPYMINYLPPDAGKTIFYQLRWLSKSGKRGEWSQTVEATVNG